MRYVCEHLFEDSGRDLAHVVEHLINEPRVLKVVAVSYAPSPFVGGEGALVTLLVNEAGD